MTMVDKDEGGNWANRYFTTTDDVEGGGVPEDIEPMDGDAVELLSAIRSMGFPIIEWSVNELEGVMAVVIGRRV